MTEIPKKKFAEGMCFYKLFWIFLFGCVFGAYYEQILNMVIHYNYHHEIVWQLRRGVIYGYNSDLDALRHPGNGILYGAHRCVEQTGEEKYFPRQGL